ncbi:hypothetical protein GZH47_33000 (plasmid) [Paenibacillus rhizovicinus]|uniref:Uncharacterized protein n=1 Tax=Paenibacillus rhizovicinus TaxID=2704463 RepID=A0A6C0PCJ3_9BACL|nr:hypothetical protein [Paenibacillus rhizovicinus]QHW35713.1 hypothetical protein GZH47_33000 [Paenibacillus rhizovicinus]
MELIAHYIEPRLTPGELYFIPGINLSYRGVYVGPVDQCGQTFYEFAPALPFDPETDYMVGRQSMVQFLPCELALASLVPRPNSWETYINRIYGVYG